MKKLLMVLPLLLFAMTANAEGGFEMGYGEALIPYGDDVSQYYVAGYNENTPATGVLDGQYAKAVWLDDGQGGIVLISVDCVALGRSDVKQIRKMLQPFCERTGCRAVHIVSTHDHAGADTLGLWGEPLKLTDGKNEAFMEALRGACVTCAEEAYAASSRGRLYFGHIETKALLEDTRKPEVYDPELYSFRFVPDDDDLPVIRLLNFGAHAESLDGSNTLLSADYPYYVAQYLAEEEGSRVIWFPGAVGGLIRTIFVKEDRVENCLYTAKRIAEYALSIDNERELNAGITIQSIEFEAKCENPVFILAQLARILDEDACLTCDGLFVTTELTYLEIGDVPILLVPGEIFPELVYGNDTWYKGHSPEKALTPLTELFGEDLLIFGLADDEIGYIVSPENFLLNEDAPYISRVRDGIGEDHYEETNSLGPDTAQSLYEAAERLAARTRY